MNTESDLNYNEDWSERLKEITESNKRDAELLIIKITEKINSINTTHLIPILTHLAHYVREDEDVHEYSFIQRMRETPVVHFLCGLALQNIDNGKGKPYASAKEIYDLIEDTISYLFKTSPFLTTEREEAEDVEKHFLLQGHKQTIRMIRPINPERYPFQTESFVKEIDKRIADIFIKKYGISPNEFFEFGTKIKIHTEKKLNQVLTQKLDSLEIENIFNQTRPEIENLLSEIKEEEEQEIFIDFHSRHLISSCVADSLVFSSNDIVEEFGLNDEEVKKLNLYLTLCSNSYGDQRQSSDILIDNVLFYKPLIRWDDKYFCPAPADLTSALPLTLEKLIEDEKQPPTRAWDRFQKAKASFVEDKAQEFLERVFPNNCVHKNVIYKFKGNVEEVDVLIPYDNKLIIIQAKSGSLNNAARRGAEESFKTAIKRLVEDAYKQAIKVRNYIQEVDKPIFTLKDGTVVYSPDNTLIGKLDYIFINLTLEPLGALSARIKELSTLGFFKEREYPISMSIFDLETITDIIPSSPSIFIHYLKERILFQEEGLFHLQDELTAFGYYLHNGSLKKPIGEDFESISYISLDTSYIYEFDDYYLRNADRPQSKMRADWVDLIKHIESLKKPFHTQITERLLNMSLRMQNRIIDKIESVYNKKAKKNIIGLASVATVLDPVGVTFITEDCGKEELEETLTAICQLRMYQARKNEWVGLAKARRSNGPWWKTTCVQFQEIPWSFNPQLEKIENTFRRS